MTLRRIGFPLLFFVVAILASCSPPVVGVTPQVVTVYATAAAQPWLSDLYDCASRSSVIIRLSESPSVTDLRLQIGDPEYLSGFAYQIDTEEILIVTNRQSPVQNLTLEQAQTLFMGLGDPSVQIWVYASDADVSGVFDQFVMKGRSVSSSARVAVNPQLMSDMLNADPNAIGILPRHWATGNVRRVFLVATVPVLAITESKPQGAVNQLIGCLQK